MHRTDGWRRYGRHGFPSWTSSLLASGLFLLQRLPRIARRFDLLLSRWPTLLRTTSCRNPETPLRRLRWGTSTTIRLIALPNRIDYSYIITISNYSWFWRTSVRKRKVEPGTCVILPVLNAIEFWAVSVTSCAIRDLIASTVSTPSFPSIATLAENQSESIKVKKLISLLWRVSQVCISSFRSIDGRNGRWDFSLGTNHFEILLMAFFHEVLCPSTKAFFHF